ncbi:MAG: hypothetical protein E7041_02410 [Lentisphaerae bacterium]|nr:hypothetical protein [Lentisphaerota bacterium]MBQ9803691.1 hypothetical protein [Lentisphaeria bacterium]
MRAVISSVAALIAAVVLGGCGYSVGPIGHPQLKTVAVAPVANETLSYNAAAQMRNLLSECFTTDGTMKLVSATQADCIVYASVKEVTISEVSWSSNDDDDYQPNEWRCRVKVNYSVIIPGRGKPLIKERSVTGSAEFVTGPDLESSRLNGMRQAMFDASKTIVSNITEAW